jgi:hypothetical protein
MEKIPQYYWLYSETRGFEDQFSLYDVLQLFFAKNIPILFSKIGNKVVGFLAYKEKNKEITSIKIASFFDDSKRSNPMLAADLINFVEKEISRRDKITWIADERNRKANDQYVQLLNQRKFIWSREKEDKRSYMWAYTVTGKNR